MYRSPAAGETKEPRARLVVEDLVAAHGETVALRGVSFSLEAGRVYALVGPNGAGKTTLLRCLAGVHLPLRGRAVLDGVDLLSAEGVTPRVGWMPDALPPDVALCSLRQLVHEARVVGASEADAEREAARWVDAVGLGQRATIRLDGLSLGEKQRLGVALALIGDPPLALLDEPTNGLDPDGRAMLAARLREAGARGTTVLVSSHVVAELDTFCDGCVLLDAGVVTTVGTLAEITGTAAGEALAAVTFAHDVDVATVTSCVRGVDGVRVLACAGRSARLVVPDDDEARASTLRALLLGGLRVVEFARERAQIAEVYSRRGSQKNGGT